jgi:hypothetical protein
MLNQEQAIRPTDDSNAQVQRQASQPAGYPTVSTSIALLLRTAKKRDYPEGVPVDSVMVWESVNLPQGADQHIDSRPTKRVMNEEQKDNRKAVHLERACVRCRRRKIRVGPSCH